MHIFAKMNTEMALLVNGGREQHKAFKDEFKIRPPILVDEDGAVGEAYGIYQPNCEGPYPYYMAPSVVLVDAKGKISTQWLLSGPRGRPHPECILGILGLAQSLDWTY